MSLQAIRTAKLIVPPLYNLEPCRIEPQGVYGEDVRNLENACRDRALKHSDLSLMAHVNYFSQNMHIMAVSVEKEKVPELDIVLEEPSQKAPLLPTPSSLHGQEDRSHIITIPRPPEWFVAQTDSGESDSDDTSDESDEEVSSEQEHEERQAAPYTGPERGIAISLPHLELYGIEILELSSPSITVKCTRCKSQIDIMNLKSSGKTSSMKSETCKKCGIIFAIGFRTELMHSNSVRAGYFDLDGCTIVDLLPR